MWRTSPRDRAPRSAPLVTRGFGGGPGSGSGGGAPTPGANATAFLARTTGIDTAHQNAYINFINGLDTDSLFTKFDVIYLFAAQTSTAALLNIPSATFTPTIFGAPTFTTDRGYQGTEGSATISMGTGFNAATASSPKFVQNSAHLSTWVVTNGQGTACLGIAASGANTYVFPRFTDDKNYVRINTGAFVGDNVTNTDSRGHFILNRSGASAVEGYKNGSSVNTNTNASNAVPSGQMFTLGWNNGGTVIGYGQQIAAVSIGSSLNGTDANNFYTRLRTYMTAVGVP